MNKIETLNLLMKRSATKREKLLYLFLRDGIVTEEDAWDIGIENLTGYIALLRKQGWVIENIESFTYRIKLNGD